MSLGERGAPLSVRFLIHGTIVALLTLRSAAQATNTTATTTTPAGATTTLTTTFTTDHTTTPTSTTTFTSFTRIHLSVIVNVTVTNVSYDAINADPAMRVNVEDAMRDAISTVITTDDTDNETYAGMTIFVVVEEHTEGIIISANVEPLLISAVNEAYNLLTAAITAGTLESTVLESLDNIANLPNVEVQDPVVEYGQVHTTRTVTATSTTFTTTTGTTTTATSTTTTTYITEIIGEMEIEVINHNAPTTSTTTANNIGGNGTSNNNTGDNNTGANNTGDNNTGDNNTGANNTGADNTSTNNTGDNSTNATSPRRRMLRRLQNSTGDNNTGDNSTNTNNTGTNGTSANNSDANNASGNSTGDNNTGDNSTTTNDTSANNSDANNTSGNTTGDNTTGDNNTGDNNTGDNNTGANATSVLATFIADPLALSAAHETIAEVGGVPNDTVFGTFENFAGIAKYDFQVFVIGSADLVVQNLESADPSTVTNILTAQLQALGANYTVKVRGITVNGTIIIKETTTTEQPAAPDSGGDDTGMAIGIGIAAIIVLAVLLCLCFIIFKMSKGNKQHLVDDPRSPKLVDPPDTEVPALLDPPGPAVAGDVPSGSPRKESSIHESGGDGGDREPKKPGPNPFGKKRGAKITLEYMGWGRVHKI